MRRFRLRTALGLSATVLATLVPGAAAAQQPQPWSNTTGDGVRVPELSDPSGEGTEVRIRMDAGRYDAALPSSTNVAGNPSESSGRRSVRNGVSYGGSMLFRRGGNAFEVFATGVAWEGTESTDANVPFASTLVKPGRSFKQWGDGNIGLRWMAGDADTLLYGAEGGVLLVGAINKDDPNGCCAFMNGSATSAYARALAGWRSEPGSFPVRVNGSIGLMQDNTFAIWDSLEREAALPERDPYPEERRAFGFYGKNGPIQRAVLGANAILGHGLLFQGFAETTLELNALQEMALRFTPGLRIDLSRMGSGSNLPSILAYADLNPLSGADPEYAPAEPFLRYNLGVQYAFGARESRASGRTPPRGRPLGANTGGGTAAGTGTAAVSSGDSTTTTRTTPAPTPVPAAQKFTLRVIDESGTPVRNLTLGIGVGPERITRNTDENGVATFDRGRMNAGKLTVSFPPLSKRAQAFTNWPLFPPALTLEPSGDSEEIQIYSVQSAGQVRLRFTDSAGKPSAKDVRVRLVADGIPQYSGTALTSYHVSKGVLFPLPPGRWRVDLDPDGDDSWRQVWTGNITPGVIAKLDVPVESARPVAAATPRADRSTTFASIFLADVAEVRATTAQPLVDTIKRAGSGKVTITVVMKSAPDSDDLFLEALGRARRDQLKNYLKSQGLPADAFVYEVDKGPDDAVKLRIE